ncbi:GNAT family N-acetyltransferase [Denitrobaculum tricleocarpae]|uniref:GNAT family N-acetyltransferase n=1 Tax=Denitrobaculum tricleocarpae TaxID=2591009 RepID=UPI0015D24798|nr:GNAT family N-acetyltransferase [Denitrobaculum tricleocarpae]
MPRITLRPLKPENARNFALLLGGVTRPASMMARLPHPCTRSSAQDWIEAHSTADSWAFGIFRNRDRNFLGAVALNTAEAVPELGYWVGRPYWSCGYATEAVHAIQRIAADRGITRLAAETFAQNQASQRVLLKAGFRPEGAVPRDFPAAQGTNDVYRYEKDLRCSHSFFARAAGTGENPTIEPKKTAELAALNRSLAVDTAGVFTATARLHTAHNTE